MRALTLADHPRVSAIERAAGEAFRDLGMGAIAEDDPFTVEELVPFVVSGLAWITEDTLAYLVAMEVDGALHVEQVSVDPVARGRGLGAGLLDHAAAEARRLGLDGLTLTTFREVPWNAPYYSRLGFVVVDELSPGLAKVRAHEAEIGLDRWPRVAMRRGLTRAR